MESEFRDGKGMDRLAMPQGKFPLSISDIARLDFVRCVTGLAALLPNLLSSAAAKLA